MSVAIAVRDEDEPEGHCLERATRRHAHAVDPFVLPPSTTSQFVLLVVLTLTSSAYVADFLTGGGAAWEARYNSCTAAADAAATLLPAIGVAQLFSDCFVHVNLTRAGLGLLAVGVVGIALVLGARLHPWWLSRRQGLVPLGADRFPVATAEIARSVAEAGLARSPEVLVDAVRTTRGGRAFGTRRRPRIKLGVGLLTGDPADLRAVLRHELAHLRNRDVGVTAVVIVTPWVFVGAVLVPTVLATLVIGTVAEAWALGWRLLLVVALQLVVRASVFRAREHHADVRAASVAGDDDVLPAPWFAGQAPSRRRVAALLSAHPDRAARWRTVAEPNRLLRPDVLAAVATGLTAAISFCYLRNLAIALLGDNVLFPTAVAGLLIGLLVAAVCGLGVIRGALVASVTGRAVPSGVGTGIALAAGLALGELLVPVVMAGWPATAVRHPGTALVMLGVLVVGCVTYTRWTATTATAWLAVSRARRLRTPAWAVLLLGAVVFGMLYGPWVSTTGGLAISGNLANATSMLPTNGLMLLPVLAALALGPAAALRSRSGRSQPRAVLLGSDPVRLPVPYAQPWLVVGPALVAVAFSVALTLTLVLRQGTFLELLGLGGRTPVPGELAVADALTFVGLGSTPGMLTVVVVTVLAAVAGVLARTAHALLAGSVATVLVAAGLLVRPLLTCGGPCVANSANGLGAVLALTFPLVAGATAAAVPATAVARRFVIGNRRQPPAPWRPVRGRRTVSVLFAVMVVVVAVPVVISGLSVVGVGALSPTPGTVDSELRTVPLDPGRTTAEAACTAYLETQNQTSGLDLSNVPQLRAARLATHQPANALLAAGLVYEQGLMTGDQALIDLGNRMLYPICTRMVAL